MCLIRSKWEVTIFELFIDRLAVLLLWAVWPKYPNWFRVNFQQTAGLETSQRLLQRTLVGKMSSQQQ